ncbi:hypothetical protein BS47DRAFT_1371823 [Hydnum rufescens UP504]|uniref:Uncharacterized protein n=1 Tax=Hydnum rufescens UP504 TaxID=1448309 RepID=A0A9P6B1T2_9AGAM|nr:hypothetical protein BS47DRAFT_1371823 [Hydnum rufescens UP504]
MTLPLPLTHQPVWAAWSLEKLAFERALALGSAVDDSSARSYNSATQSYLSFCKLHHFPIDPTPDSMSFYVVFMCAHIRPSSVRAYLSGIAHGLESFYPHVRSVTSSKIRRGLAVRRKRALSLDDLHQLLQAYSSSSSHDDMLFLALTFTAFFALLRLGEVVVPDSFSLRKSRKMIRQHPLSISPDSFSFVLPFHKADCFFEGSLSDDRIQALGHWSSDAFKVYIRKHPLLLHALIRGGHSVAASVH